MDVIEKIMRSLIKEGKLSRARALLSLFYEDYPHLALELEIAAGNYETALNIYEKLSDEMKKEYRTTMEDIKKAIGTKGYKEDFKDAVVEYTKGNYQGSVALLEGITKDYPELVEAIALKYEIYLKRGDTSKAREIEEILRRFDSTHPALAENNSQKNKKLDVALWIVSITAIILIIMVTITMSKFSKITSEISSVVKSEVKQELSQKFSEFTNKIEEVKEDLKAKIEENFKNITDLSEKLDTLEKIQKSIDTSIEQKLGQPPNNIAEVKIPDMEKMFERLDNIEKVLNNIQISITNISSYTTAKSYSTTASSLKSILIPGEVVYKPSSELDKAKIYWLAGYIMYLRDQYNDAIDLFKKALKIVEVLYPHAYFHDDCIYYLGLSYYMEMNYEMAEKYFKFLKNEFPESQYIDDAELFMKNIPGGG